MTDSPPAGESSPGDLFADMPLFREIQRVLLSSPGPVNWEMARQVAVAMTSLEPGADPPPSDADRTGFEDAVRVAELQVAQLTGMTAPTEVANIRVVRRAEWIGANIDEFKDLIEPSALRMQAALADLQSSTEDEESDRLASASDSGPFDLSLDQLTPLLFGTQAGSVFGYLGQNVLGRFDISFPPAETTSMLFVTPNIAAFERDWSLPPMDFREWVALHEVAHRFEFSRPWIREHFASLVDDYSSTMKLDVEGLRERIETLDMSSPDSMQSMMPADQGLFGTVLDDEQRIKLARIQAFMGATEGFADHVTHVLGRQMLSSYSRIDEAMRRYREGETRDPVFDQLLGIDVTREHYALGRTFCDQVVEAADEGLLSRMWDSAEALPSMPELTEPRLWLARTT